MAQEPHHPETHHPPARRTHTGRNNNHAPAEPVAAPQAAPPQVAPLAAPPPSSVPVAPPGPAVHAFAITPSDGTALARRTTAIYVGGAGNIAVIAAGDDPAGMAVVFMAVPVGTVIPVSASYVKATNTTATNLVGLG